MPKWMETMTAHPPHMPHYPARQKLPRNRTSSQNGNASAQISNRPTSPLTCVFRMLRQTQHSTLARSTTAYRQLKNASFCGYSDDLTDCDHSVTSRDTPKRKRAFVRQCYSSFKVGTYGAGSLRKLQSVNFLRQLRMCNFCPRIAREWGSNLLTG